MGCRWHLHHSDVRQGFDRDFAADRASFSLVVSLASLVVEQASVKRYAHAAASCVMNRVIQALLETGVAQTPESVSAQVGRAVQCLRSVQTTLLRKRDRRIGM